MEGALEQGNLKLGLDSGWPPQALTGLLMTAHGTWSPKGAIFSSFFSIESFLLTWSGTRMDARGLSQAFLCFTALGCSCFWSTLV